MLQQRARRDHDAASSQAPLGRWSGRAPAVPPWRRRRRTDVLPPHRRGGRAARGAGMRARSNGAGRARLSRPDLGYGTRAPRRCCARHATTCTLPATRSHSPACSARSPLRPTRRARGGREPSPESGSRRGRAARPGRAAPARRRPHAFLRTLPDGRRVEVEHFDTVRPDAVLEVERLDLMIEIDDRLPLGADAAKLERYDHFVSGWSLHTSRYGVRGRLPRVIVVCRDGARARESARTADSILGACRAYPGEYPFDCAPTPGARRFSSPPSATRTKGSDAPTGWRGCRRRYASPPPRAIPQQRRPRRSHALAGES